MKLKVYDRPEVFDVLRDEWNTLVWRSTSNRIFSTWEWNSTWWQAYQPGTLLIVTCRDDDDKLIGIAPWFISASDNTLSMVGCKEVTDYLDVIVDRNHIEVVLESLVVFLTANLTRYQYIEFCNIPEDSLSYTALPQKLSDCGFKTVLEREDVCPIVPLPGNWTDYLSQLDKKNRHELRRKLRRSQGNSANVDWYIVGEEHDLRAEIDTFLTMMSASDVDKTQFLSDAHNLAFFRAIIPVMFDAGWLQLNFLTVDDEKAAAYLNFDYNNEIMVYNSGIYSEQFGHLSPGIVLLAHNIQYAIEAGRTAFDFLQGDEEYKYRMGGQDKVVYNLIATFDS